MMKTTERILILDGHTNQALACVRSLGMAGYTMLVASHKRFPLGAWSRYCAGSFVLTEQAWKPSQRCANGPTEKASTLFFR